jgi:hypothetical protein
MTSRLAPLVTTKRFPRFGVSLQLPEVPVAAQNPAQFKEWERDGLAGIAAPSAVLQKLIECTPLQWWSATIDRTLTELFERVEGTDFEREVVVGICHAAVVARREHITDSSWIVPLWMNLLARDHKPQRDGSTQNIWWIARASLVALMTPGEVATLFGLCASLPNNLAQLLEVFTALDALPLADRVAIPTKVADSIADAIVKNPDQANLVSHHNMGFVLTAMSPTAIEKLMAILTEKWPSEAHRIRHLQAAHSISTAIAQEFP